MKTPVSFLPAKNPRLTDQTPLPRAHGFQTAYGLVIHPSVDIAIRQARGYWDVSDPVTGCLVAYGEYPGPDGAIAGLVQKAMQFKARPGGFRGAIERGRRVITAEQQHPIQAGIDRTTSGAIGQP